MDAGDMYTDWKKTCILQTLLFKEFAMKPMDRSGQRFGRLIAIEQAGRDNAGRVMWRCKCDCGNEKSISSLSLVTGNTLSCGCYFKDRVTKHGGHGKSSFNTWRSMMRRCYNIKDKDFPNWGGKGIAVCNEWHDYKVFAKDMGEPQGDETLDRVDPYGPYTKENCRWASKVIQARNIRVPKSSKTGITGVIFHNKKFYSAITVKKKKYYSKCFDTLEEAAAARKELELLHWGTA
jgi:hypothetical protein